MEIVQKDFVSCSKFKQIKIKNEEYFKKNRINPFELSNSQRNHVDKLIDIVKICENHPVYSKLAYIDVVRFIKETSNLSSYGITLVFRSILNQLKANLRSPRGRNYLFRLDPNLLVYLRHNAKF